MTYEWESGLPIVLVEVHQTHDLDGLAAWSALARDGFEKIAYSSAVTVRYSGGFETRTDQGSEPQSLASIVAASRLNNYNHNYDCALGRLYS